MNLTKSRICLPLLYINQYAIFPAMQKLYVLIYPTYIFLPLLLRVISTQTCWCSRGGVNNYAPNKLDLTTSNFCWNFPRSGKEEAILLIRAESPSEKECLDQWYASYFNLKPFILCKILSQPEWKKIIRFL